MDTFKEWLIKLGIQEMGPSAIRGAVLGAIGWLAMRNNMVPGVHTDAATHITTIAWDQVSTWAIAGLPAAVAAVIKGLQFHGNNVIQAVKPQGEIK